MKKQSLPFFTLTTITLLFLSTASYASKCNLIPYQATYFGSYNGWKITTNQRLSLAQAKSKNVASTPSNNWLFEIEANNFIGSISEKSYFSFDKGLLKSGRYKYRRSILGKKQYQKTLFDWKKNIATAEGKRTGAIPLKGNELDRLNYQLLLRCDLLLSLNDSELIDEENKQEFSYPVINKNHLESFAFKIVGEEKLKTKLGVLDTIIVKRQRSNDNRFTTIWFAKDLDYAMVKLLQEERRDAQAYLLYIEDYKVTP